MRLGPNFAKDSTILVRIPKNYNPKLKGRLSARVSDGSNLEFIPPENAEPGSLIMIRLPRRNHPVS
eukprot:CAMPEP_0197318396 /NCGR_PEP_ID=MMETSP0891-20130614/50907_1 /TAXON_ID=44058 ORGANISM="Aureoumbra lagunensis, Strain CCMP1510" /NCGR_SAMPLE_ID=MMETSP0891 /ASSEMBLY_ACC=CAM_ASM_000534 /LENGTH=65 /DNA_ID=CAMNT_0042808841 /DNA_START=106 /DNA_END=300 /DNA_ORIENTATION=-